MPKRTDRLTDAALQAIQGFLVQYGEPGRPMKQKTLARRSGQSYARVHRFISGQMPYPPMDFLDALLRTFGTTLADVLKGHTTPPKQLPILRADVQRVADMLDDASVEVVEETERHLKIFLRAAEAGALSDRPNESSTAGRTPEASGTRTKRGTRRG